MAMFMEYTQAVFWTVQYEYFSVLFLYEYINNIHIHNIHINNKKFHYNISLKERKGEEKNKRKSLINLKQNPGVKYFAMGLTFKNTLLKSVHEKEKNNSRCLWQTLKINSMRFASVP